MSLKINEYNLRLSQIPISATEISSRHLQFRHLAPFSYPPTDYLFHLPCPACNYPRRPLHRSAGLDHRSTSCPAFYRRKRCRSARLSGIPVWCSSPRHLKHRGGSLCRRWRCPFPFFNSNKFALGEGGSWGCVSSVKRWFGNWNGVEWKESKFHGLLFFNRKRIYSRFHDT